MKRYTKVLLIVATILTSWSVSASPNYIKKEVSSDPMQVRMVLFTAADVKIPTKYRERFKGMADYAEAFFTQWMNHWGYTCDNPLQIERDADGYPLILNIKGKHNRDHEAYKELKGIKKEVMQQAESKYNVSQEGQVWWIFNYPRKKRGSRGGGNAQTGGTSFGNYMDSDEQIDLNMELGEGMHEQILLKSLIHELTHALGLGHIGPRDFDNLGNSLMGPVNRAYKKRYPNDSRVYLSEASAAILWKHPLFDGKNEGPLAMPSVEVKSLKASYNKEKNVFVVEGKLKSDQTAHSIVVSNASKGDASPYWHKAFVGKVKSNGSFSCEVSELNDANGELVIAFCFENGAVTGNGKRLGLNNGGIKKAYAFQNSEFIFK
ncbi:MAG: hypothetical protein N4A74_24560 [Carboxylicivirga sp.]|jgi:hypothetical protein|nr:hypothetical protein [Carboxylicivirga sp.]